MLLPSNGACGVGCGQLTMVVGGGGHRRGGEEVAGVVMGWWWLRKKRLSVVDGTKLSVSVC